MLNRTRIVTAGFTLATLAVASPISERPLSSIEPGSKIEISRLENNFTNSHFQNGKRALSDPNGPFCVVELTWFEKQEEKEKSLTTTAVVAGVDSSSSPYFGKSGRTVLAVEGPEVLGTIRCNRSSDKLFIEPTLSDFEQSLKGFATLGDISLESDAADRDLIRLTGEELEQNAMVKVQQNFPEVELDENGYQNWHVQGEKLVAESALKIREPYCRVMGQGKDAHKLLAQGAELRFKNPEFQKDKRTNFAKDPRELAVVRHVNFMVTSKDDQVKVLCSDGKGRRTPGYDTLNITTKGMMSWTHLSQ